jgi:sugar/nucleoside kinase (ribokinase family)
VTAIRVGVLGPTASDQIVQADGGILRRQGGSPLYAARALRAAGAEPVAIETGSLVSYLDHTAGVTRQSILSLPDPLDIDRTAALLPRLRGCEWVVLGGQTGGDFPPESIALLADAGHEICLDAQGLARGSRTGPVQLGPIDPGWVERVTALKLNDAEAEASGPLTVPELLVTMAERGCTVTAGGTGHRLVGSGLRFADPTGAGDSFCALYCLARSGGSSPPEAAAWAQRRVEQLYAR